MTYYADYETVPIGGGNPYYKCKHCGCSDPYINGILTNHHADCEYRVRKERELKISKVKGRKITRTDFINYAKIHAIQDGDFFVFDDDDLEKFVDYILEFERKV